MTLNRARVLYLSCLGFSVGILGIISASASARSASNGLRYKVAATAAAAVVIAHVLYNLIEMLARALRFS